MLASVMQPGQLAILLILPSLTVIRGSVCIGYVGMVSDYVNGAEILKTVYLCDDKSKCSDYCPHNSFISYGGKVIGQA